MSAVDYYRDSYRELDVSYNDYNTAILYQTAMLYGTSLMNEKYHYKIPPQYYSSTHTLPPAVETGELLNYYKSDFIEAVKPKKDTRDLIAYYYKKR